MGLVYSLVLFNNLSAIPSKISPDLNLLTQQESFLIPSPPFSRQTAVPIVSRADRASECPEAVAGCPHPTGIERPEQARHGLYLTLLEGDFLQGRKTAEKNILVRMQLRQNSDGQPISMANFFHGYGLLARPTQDPYSTLYYHCNRPRWNDRWILEFALNRLCLYIPLSLVSQSVFWVI